MNFNNSHRIWDILTRLRKSDFFFPKDRRKIDYRMLVKMKSTIDN